MISKQQIRDIKITERKQLSTHDRNMMNQQIIHRIQALTVYHDAKNIACYHAMSYEVDLKLLCNSAMLRDKNIYLPALTDHSTLIFLPITLNTTFKPNRFGILEPIVNHNEALTPDQFDLMILPLLAFDQKGTRLGMGGGFYDRTLAQQELPKVLMGVAYECQRYKGIPHDKWDIPLSMIVTNSAVEYF